MFFFVFIQKNSERVPLNTEKNFYRGTGIQPKKCSKDIVEYM